MHSILTIGHSDHDPQAFLALLGKHHVEVLVDIRSQPYSRRMPHFTKSALERAVRNAGLRYLYLGEHLGGRPLGTVRKQMLGQGYAAMAATTAFRQAIERVLTGANNFRLALMCAERDPIDCHRTLLVGRALSQAGAALAHIHHDGKLENQADLDRRLLALAGHGDGGDLFSSTAELLALAYRQQEIRVGVQDTLDEEDGSGATP